MAVKDEQWPRARLIPISSASGIEAQERRAASALLAVLGAVNEFGRSILKPLGAPAGRVETFIEIPFKQGGKSLRPDGIITVTRGERTWTALVECKTGPNALEANQIDMYLDLARELEFDSLLTISNQYATSSTDYPVEVDRRKLRRVALHHLSWVDLLTQAVVDENYRGVRDPDQAYMLSELIRYLSDRRSGVVYFDGMGPSWTTVRDGARERTLRKNDESVGAVAARWDELVRYVALDLTKDLGRDVRQTLDKSERTPSTRLASLRNSLATSGRLYADLQVPNVAGVIHVAADLSSRQVVVSTRVDAPREGKSKGRVSWLLRQLQNAPDNVKVEVRVSRASTTLATTLGHARQDPTVLYPEAGKDVRQFVLSTTHNMGVKRGEGRGSFIDSVLEATKVFYGDVLQNLRAWKAPPPKLPKHREDIEEEVSAMDLATEVEEGISKARQEMEETPEAVGETQSTEG